jgi:hypothetical protein
MDPFTYMATQMADSILDGGPYQTEVLRQRIINHTIELLDKVGPTRITLAPR